jgi:hypothetical protein
MWAEIQSLFDHDRVQPRMVRIGDGERSKRLATVTTIIEAMNATGVHGLRVPLVVIGGGVALDCAHGRDQATPNAPVGVQVGHKGEIPSLGETLDLAGITSWTPKASPRPRYWASGLALPAWRGSR